MTHVIVLFLAGNLTAQVNTLLVYEPFDYPAGQMLKGRTPPVRENMSGQSGMVGSWTATSNQGGDNGFQVTTGLLEVVNGPPYTPIYDGTSSSVPYVGNYAGHPHIGNGVGVADHLWASIGLHSNVTATFIDHTSTWMSCVVAATHFRWVTFDFAIGSGIVDDSGFLERGHQSSGPALGVGVDNYDLRDGNPNFASTFWNIGYNSVATSTAFVRDNRPYIAVARIDWMPNGSNDHIRVAAFTNGTLITEAAFDAAAALNSVDFDQSTFTNLSLAGCRYSVDELRIGTSFNAVIIENGLPLNALLLITR